MASQLVPVRNDAPHQGGVPSGDPTQGEEGRFDLHLGEDVEYPLGIAFNPAWQVLPMPAIDRRSEGFDVKIILDVDRHRVRDAWAHSLPTTRIDRRRGRVSVPQHLACDTLDLFGWVAHGRSF